MLTQVEVMMRDMVSGLDPYTLELYDKLPAGKRLRAKLILKIASNQESVIKLASIVELIHAASLLHDDVIDDSDSRRGVSSLNALYGNKSAIMLGDILYSKGFSSLTSFDSKIASLISEAVAMLSIGELIDVELSKSLNFDESRYFDMIYKKTAVLIEASAESAALLSGRDASIFALYGKNLGLAFQIIDDVLDIIADSKILGKPAMHDFKEGKTTLPYIYLFESMDEDERAELTLLYKKDLTLDQEIWIQAKMREHGVLEKAISVARELGEEALDAIAGENDQMLEDIIKSMIEREF